MSRSFNQNRFINSCLTWCDGWLRTRFRANAAVQGPYFLILMIQYCSHFNLTIKSSLHQLGLDFPNIPRGTRLLFRVGIFDRKDNSTISLRLEISQHFSNCFLKVFDAKIVLRTSTDESSTHHAEDCLLYTPDSTNRNWAFTFSCFDWAFYTPLDGANLFHHLPPSAEHTAERRPSFILKLKL